MYSRSKYHYLINGPRTIQQNLVIFNELCKFISIQIALIAAQLKFYLNIKFQDTLTKLLFCLSMFMEKVIWVENSWTGYCVNGKLVKLNWL